MSYGSGRTTNQETNLLAGAHQREMQDGGRATQGANQGGGQPPQRVLGGIPDKINNNDMLDIGSHVTGGLEGGTKRQWGGGRGRTSPTCRRTPRGQQTHQGPRRAIAARLQAIPTCRDDVVIERKLDWQSRVEGDINKCTAFRDQVVNQTKLLAFAFMKGKSPVVHMAHSIGKFFDMSGLAVDVQGKYIGFIGDSGNG